MNYNMAPTPESWKTDTLYLRGQIDTLQYLFDVATEGGVWCALFAEMLDNRKDAWQHEMVGANESKVREETT